MNIRSLFLCPLVAALPASGLEIELDYSLDTQNFFNQAGSREALRAVADLFERLIMDELEEIDPSQFFQPNWIARPIHPGTGERLAIVNRQIPANTVLIFVGGRDLGGGTTGQASTGFTISGTQSFLDLVIGRGQAGAIGDRAQRTDSSVQIASIAFDNDRNWNFTTENQNGSEFYSTAIHEFCHVFGIGQADSWYNLITNGNFTGSNAMRSFGGVVPITGDQSHWQSDGVCNNSPGGFDPNNPLNVLSQKIGIFGASHGDDQIAIMDPGRCDNGQNFSVLTDLDLAALMDIGWQVAPDVDLTLTRNAQNQPAFSWQTLTPFDYRLSRSMNLITFTPLSPTRPAAVTLGSYTDSAAPAVRAFYRLEATPRSSSQARQVNATSRAQSEKEETQILHWEQERTISCSCSHHPSEHSQ